MFRGEKIIAVRRLNNHHLGLSAIAPALLYLSCIHASRSFVRREAGASHTEFPSWSLGTSTQSCCFPWLHSTQRACTRSHAARGNEYIFSHSLRRLIPDSRLYNSDIETDNPTLLSEYCYSAYSFRHPHRLL